MVTEQELRDAESDRAWVYHYDEPIDQEEDDDEPSLSDRDRNK